MITLAVLDAQITLTLLLTNECPWLYDVLISLWRNAAILPQRNHFLHDLIYKAFNSELWCLASLMLSFLPITNIAVIRRVLGILVTA